MKPTKSNTSLKKKMLFLNQAKQILYIAIVIKDDEGGSRFRQR
jgi:hypothetical protein